MARWRWGIAAGWPCAKAGVPAGTIRLQSFQRGRGCLLQRRRVLLDGGQRLAQPGPDLNRHSAQRIEDFFFPSRLRLLFSEDLSTAAVPGAQPQDVLASEACNRAFQNRGAPGSLADLASDLWSEPRLGRPVHQTQYLLDLLVRNETEERGLFQLHRQPLAKRLVKDRIARLVLEFSQDNRVLRGEFRRPVQIKVASGAQCQDRRGAGNDAFPLAGTG